MTMYVSPNLKSKKALKDAVKAGAEIGVFQAGLGDEPKAGRAHVCGPHYPKPHAWYAIVEIDADGTVVKVVS